ncbi:sterol desaturase family protein [Salmonirosea aquatica]|uniref:Sterol desaturase family protein n=1 Tax=Salmonirosea aquatica TaxID=2654236 RepID=A0A7C9F8S2_9BACT|nr:sterol desaturase family protein [Cytophagaceae bacterium SJW1-29]
MEIIFEELIIQFSTPLYLLLIGAEVFLSHAQHRVYYSWRDTFMNALLMMLNAGIDLSFRILYIGILAWFFDIRFLEPLENPYLYWFALFLAEDFIFYILHYVDHKSRLFWAIHVTHHSSEYFNLTTGFRSSVFQPLYRFVYFVPLVVLGFRPADIVLMYSITQIYGILVHTKYIDRLGWLEKVLVTPSHHRVHHASNIEYLDRNMGMCLIIWDKLFGTFQEELDEVELRFGLTKSLDDTSVENTVFHEWKEIVQDVKQQTTWKLRLGYLLKPPGWSHDGSRLTAEQLREAYLSQKKGSSESGGLL